jgi:hypothetical protein
MYDHMTLINSPDKIIHVSSVGDTESMADRIVTYNTGEIINRKYSTSFRSVINIQNLPSKKDLSPCPSITDLKDPRVRLVKPILLDLNVQSDGVILCFKKAHISTSGDNFHDAYDWMVETIVSKYVRFRQHMNMLGPIPLHTLRVLETYIEAVG